MTSIHWLNAINGSFTNPADWAGGTAPGASGVTETATETGEYKRCRLEAGAPADKIIVDLILAPSATRPWS